MSKNEKTIGLGIKFPKETCEDNNCPFHGNLKVHGRTITGKVISDKMRKSIVVSWNRRVYIPKYERYLVKTSKVQAHAPECLNIKEGDEVKIIQCKPLSKLKSFVAIEKVSDNKSK